MASYDLFYMGGAIQMQIALLCPIVGDCDGGGGHILKGGIRRDVPKVDLRGGYLQTVPPVDGVGQLDRFGHCLLGDLALQSKLHRARMGARFIVRAVVNGDLHGDLLSGKEGGRFGTTAAICENVL